VARQRDQRGILSQLPGRGRTQASLLE